MGLAGSENYVRLGGWMNMGTHGGNGTPLGKGHGADRPGTRGRHLLARCVCVCACARKPGWQGLGKEAKM